MIRVCRPGGRLVLLNHFVAGDRSRRLIDRLAGAVATSASGARWDLRLDSFLDESGLTAVSVETVNLDVSSVVVCRKS
jgi:phosphatidylethanolamine/phosphatidyl-N-methylethanolamine N-methyltransferase